MKYMVSTLFVLLSLIIIGPTLISDEIEPTKPDKKPQPEIFSDKPEPARCIDKIHVQQKSMVQELEKIKNLLKKKKDLQKFFLFHTTLTTV